jgi:D-xylose transport system substrate-binding protein
MNATMRRVVIATAAVSMAVSLAACGQAKQAGGSSSDTKKKTGPLDIAVLLPENQTARYENADKPYIEKDIKHLCADCHISYANAQGDASVQQQQVDSMITKKVDVLIIDAVDSASIRSSVEKANQAGIPVVAYDRLAEGPVSAYTSFDNERIGRLQGEGLLKALGSHAKDGDIVMINGYKGDPNAAQFKQGALSVLKGKVNIARSYDIDQWKASEANSTMATAISAIGRKNIIGVYVANDGMAGGVITALQRGGFNPLPPVTGQDAELNAVQRIVTGTQYMSVYKSYSAEAQAAARFAIALGRGDNVNEANTVDSPTKKNIPATLITPVELTKDNIKQTVIKDGLYTLKQICTPQYQAACQQIGLTT